jgi:cobalt/nickel transport system permease protein
VHSLAPETKIVGALAFVMVCVLTPIGNWRAHLAYGCIAAGFVLAARLPPAVVARRATIEIPFVAFAFLMPFVGSGEDFDIAWFTVHREGLLAGASIVVKGTFGVVTAIVLAASTPARQVLRGFQRLRAPSLMVQIASFMLRYVNVANDEMERMRIARASRGFEARGPRDWRILGSAAGSMFIRSYERGERVYLAMVSRGYDGTLPDTTGHSTPRRHWARATTPALAAAVVATVTAGVGWW